MVGWWKKGTRLRKGEGGGNVHVHRIDARVSEERWNGTHTTVLFPALYE